MNTHYKKSVRCSQCDRFIGEIDATAFIGLPKCGKCVNPFPQNDDKLQYIVTPFNTNRTNKIPDFLLLNF